MALYGDPAYPLRVHLVVPYRTARITPQMKEFNKAISSVRISVEWLFGDIVNYFKCKLFLNAVGKIIVCEILRNAMTSLVGNFTSDFFKIDPPTLQDYFS